MGKFFQRLTKLHKPVGWAQFVVSKKLYKACLIKIAQQNSCEYVLIIYIKKYKIAYHSYAEAKCTH